ncbi:MAG TPA: hypothetical protein DCZ69_11000, partial [Syntrophobacteraceae bacterium]|nr:hypothetical protein [Syntrophobacteraceae bacterium]
MATQLPDDVSKASASDVASAGVLDISKMTTADILAAWRSWQFRIFVTIWITYGSFYLCRANISFALPGLTAEFGYSKTMLGLLGTALFIMYSLGQFINGQLGDKYGAR